MSIDHFANAAATPATEAGSYLCIVPVLRADAVIPFGRDHREKLTAFLGEDVYALAPTRKLQFSRLGNDPTEVYFLSDGRVVVERSRQFYRVSQIAVLASVADWAAWRRAYAEAY